MEIEDKNTIHALFQELVHSGTGFGAHRWLANLQRMAERLACFTSAGLSARDLGLGKQTIYN